MSAGSWMRSCSRRSETVRSPRPSMSIAPRLAKWQMRAQRWPGHALEHRERRRLSGTPDRHHDLLELRGALLGRELVRDGPARRLRREAELRTQPQVVDLHDHAVDLVRQVVPMLLPVLAVGVDL